MSILIYMLSKVGKLKIAQAVQFKIGKMKNEGDLNLNENVSIDLVVNAGVSDTDFDL